MKHPNANSLRKFRRLLHIACSAYECRQAFLTEEALAGQAGRLLIDG